jgi:GMP synthase-like glutamine amidotransferase
VRDRIEYLNTDVDADKIGDVVKAAHLVLLGGGADIHPSMYGHRDVASHCYGNGPSDRDNYESRVVDWAVNHKKPILGICRGAQMLCVKAGGWLVQHVDGHAGAEHEVICPDFFSKPLRTNSVHHQMMVMPRRGANVVGYTENLSNRFLYDTNAQAIAPNIDHNPEIVFFTRINGLAIQGHPEFVRDPLDRFVTATRILVSQHFGLNLIEDNYKV